MGTISNRDLEGDDHAADMKPATGSRSACWLRHARRFIDGAAGRLAQHSIARTLCHSRKQVADTHRLPPTTARRRNPPEHSGLRQWP
jgi:hypothetical protein